MKKIGFIGLGDMGMAMALNLLKAGFDVTGFDLRKERLQLLEQAGGKSANSPAEAGSSADAVFIMVMTGKQVDSVVSGENGLLSTMQTGSTIILTATIQPTEATALIEPVSRAGINLIDSPVSGGKGGADAGTLTLMAACSKELFDSHQDVLQGVGEKIFHVGDEVGIGQTVKASLQALIGSTFTAIFESLVLGSKAGVKGEILHEVFTASGVGSPLLANCSKLIMNREFKGTGSQIGTMYKDLGISMDMAKQNGCAMFTAAAAYELFRSGISLFPDEDNWSIVKLLEQIADTEVKW
ncbi:MAG: putative dehydrogenase [Verrucomicrobiales bacterium]|jgi:putative dehydrogenase